MQTPHAEAVSVSYDDEPLVLVDENDRTVGYLDKGSCHRGDGQLHRAFSVFLFDRSGRVLLQQRSRHKLLWPGFWSNSCCSHPRRGEKLNEAVRRRLLEELGVTASIEFLYKFQYSARFDDVGCERELCSVYLASTDDALRPHPEEIRAIRWLQPEQLDFEVADDPDRFTPWSLMEWRRIRAEHPLEMIRFGGGL